MKKNNLEENVSSVLINIYYVCVFFFLEIMEVKKIRESNDEVLLFNFDVC